LSTVPDCFTPLSGKNGQLFAGIAGGIDLIDLFSTAAPSGTLLHWKRTIGRRGRELKRRGIPYVVNLVPSAHIVCMADLPDDLAERLISHHKGIFFEVPLGRFV